jgi:hypothetical protein
MQDWLGRLEGSAFSQVLREAVWLYPAVEVVHILGFSVLVGAIVLFDLRVLGFAKSLPVNDLARHLLPWALAALLLIVPSGLAMFATQPLEFVGSTVFLLKLGLIAAAGLNALLFHLGVYRSVQGWNLGRTAPGTARGQALLSIFLWAGVITCGRLLAYT